MACPPKNSDPPESDQIPPSPQIAAIMAALAKARRFRHTPNCVCFAHNNLYCCAEDEKWSKVIDRELGRLCG